MHINSFDFFALNWCKRTAFVNGFWKFDENDNVPDLPGHFIK